MGGGAYPKKNVKIGQSAFGRKKLRTGTGPFRKQLKTGKGIFG